MQLPNISTAFNTPAALQKSKLLPVKIQLNDSPLTCCNCSFINRSDNNFCTNCGYPIYPNQDRLAIYNFRLQKRKNVQRLCFLRIEHARNALYVLAAFSMLGIFYIFSDIKQRAMTGFVMVLLGFIYAGLGRWSLQKPFTALLISLIIMLTFAAINTWAEFTSTFTTASGVYLLMVQIILIYFLLQGVKGAFHADILEEEFKL
ncbi:MAG: zinc ribbon protein [Segetibacter sp.]|nr:zinc ribbon protein [Segetibacter sp.]